MIQFESYELQNHYIIVSKVGIHWVFCQPFWLGFNFLVKLFAVPSISQWKKYLFSKSKFKKFSF